MLVLVVDYIFFTPEFMLFPAEVNKHITDLRLEVTEKNEQSTKQQEEISRLSDIGSKINQKNKKV